MFVFVCLFIYSRHRVELAATNSNSAIKKSAKENGKLGVGGYTVHTKIANLKQFNKCSFFKIKSEFLWFKGLISKTKKN